MRVRVPRLSAIAAAAAFAAACGSSEPSAAPSAPPATAVPTAAATAAGCGSTRLHRGHTPGWTAPAWAASSGAPTGLPYAVGVHDRAAAFVFGYPLRAGHPSDPSNKILWIVRIPRDGSYLVIHARPLHAAGPVVTVRRPPDSGPGEIYPSTVDVPTAGCWRMTLRWNGHTDSVDLPYRP
jgi:hypothetical protein